MDVILDSNIYVSDIRFAKAGFEGLFDYLRRTGHFLVIPDVVFEEVLARHRDKLTEFVNQARSGWEKAQAWQFSKSADLPKIDIDAATKRLSERLNAPTKWVKSIRYGKRSKVTAMDVALRGINRIRPASAEGEQLRDVFLWLQVLEYAKETRRGVAFISKNKKEFCEKDSTKLHPALVSECAGLGVTFYFDILDFLSDKSLAQSPLTEADLPPELNFEALDSKIALSVANERTVHGYPIEFRTLNITFKAGTLFKISEAVSIAELNYEGQVRCKFDNSRLFTVFSEGPPIEDFTTYLKETFKGKPPQTYSYTYKLSAPINIADFSEVYSASEKVLNFHAMISARFREGKLTSWDVESFRFGEEVKP